MTAKHVLEGTFRAERHAGRVDSVAPASPANLPKPDVIGEAGKWLWELTIRNLPGGVLRDQDAAKLELMCVSWEQYRKLLERMQIDDDPKLISKLKKREKELYVHMKNMVGSTVDIWIFFFFVALTR